MKPTDYTPIVGMEIHVELKTESKMFCGCKNDPFFAPQPNMYTCPACLGLPGGLPVPNQKAIDWTIKLGLALGCSIPYLSKFDRKNYFYPDLAKGYQISQYDLPFCAGGKVSIPEGDVRITRVHLEEDTGKLMHNTIDGEKVTLVDYNRSGVPLVEIVTEPDIRSGDQAKAFLKKLHQIIKYLDISLADMEKGSMRLEPNISVVMGEFTGTFPPYKVEVKNINSFNFVKKAIDFEVKRHIELLSQGQIPKQETRGYVESTSSTISQRSKENAQDYRYFPEPDIPPIRITQSYIAQIKEALPELPDAKKERLKKSYDIKDAELDVLLETKDTADYFESTIALLESSKEYAALTVPMVAKLIVNQPKSDTTVSPEELLSQAMKKMQLSVVDESTLAASCDVVLAAQPDAVKSFKAGKESVIMFLVGQVKKELHGKGDAERIKILLLERLNS